MKNVLFVSLGCDKNLVDSEKMLGLLNEAGYRVAQEESEADAIVVNTCCFIHDAKEESVDGRMEEKGQTQGTYCNRMYGTAVSG